MTEQEKALEFYNRTKIFLEQRATNSGIPLHELEWYYVPSDDSVHNIKTRIHEFEQDNRIQTWKQKAMMSFVFHAQNQTGNHIINIVKYKKNIEYIYRILYEFKPDEIISHYKSNLELVEAFRNALDERGRRVFNWKVDSTSEKPDGAMRQWCSSIIESAEYIDGFENRASLVSAMKACYDNSKITKGDNKGKYKLSKLKANFGITGFGPALTCDLFKEFDSVFSMIMKPDLHLKDALKAYDGLEEDDDLYEDDSEAYNRFVEIVEYINKSGINVSVYKFDKMVWLSCTGSFYMHNLKDKQDYIQSISEIE